MGAGRMIARTATDLGRYVRLPRTVHLLCAGTFVNRAGTLLIPFLTLYLVDELGKSVSFATLGMGVYGVGSIAGALLGGYFADRLGRRVTMLLSLLGGAVVLRLFGLLSESWAILVALALFALLADMYRPAASAMIADVVGPDDRPPAYGLMYVSVNLGFAIGARLGGLLATIWFTWLFWADALTAALYALVILFFIRETHTPASASEKAEAGFEGPATLLGPEMDPAAPQKFDTIRRILVDKPFVMCCVGTVLFGVVYMQAMSTLPIYLAGHGVDADGYGRLISLNALLVVFGQLPLTVLLSRFNRGSVLVWSAVITAAGFGMLAFTTAYWHFAVSVVVWSLGEIMAVAFMSSIVADLAPPALRARYMGVFSMCFSGSMMLGAPLGGLVLDMAGGKVLWTAALVTGLMSAAAYLGVRRHLSPAPPPSVA